MAWRPSFRTNRLPLSGPSSILPGRSRNRKRKSPFSIGFSNRRNSRRRSSRCTIGWDRNRSCRRGNVWLGPGIGQGWCFQNDVENCPHIAWMSGGEFVERRLCGAAVRWESPNPADRRSIQGAGGFRSFPHRPAGRGSLRHSPAGQSSGLPHV